MEGDSSMPRSQFVDPFEIRKKGKITFQDIPVNQYDRSIQEEKASFTTEDFLRIFRDMAIIREFESMMNLIKTTGEYNGIPYHHPGPAHLSIGQEAAAVGQAYLLDKEDFIFGSHRSHGEILAKGLSAIQKLPEEELMKIMKNFREGRILKIVEENRTGGNVKDLAIDFLIYGAMAEIFARETGFQAGLGGSMHAFFTQFGIYPNNAIVGGSGDISVGAALYKKINRKKGIVIANIGDASMGCGPVWEGICLAAMDQYKKLWEGEYRGGLPLIINFFNNHYGMGGQTSGETMGYDMLARVGAGVNPEQMHAERIDGFNPLAVIDAIRRKKKILEEKNGPVLLDTITYRFSGHSPSDASSYRTKEEVDAWMAVDPLLTYRKQLIDSDVTTDSALEDILADARELVTKTLKLSIDDSVSPRMNLSADPQAISRLMFSNQKVEKMEDRECDVLMKKEENLQWQRVQKKVRFGLDENGKPVSKNRVYQFRDGVFEAMIDKFYTDPTLIAYGEENRDWGGAFAVYRGLTEAIPYHRLFNSPISEGAIVGSAVGYGMCGGRAVVELMYADFLGRAGDEVFNQLSKWQAMSAGQIKMPIIVRISVGSKYGAQHSQDWTSIVAHIPGLKVVFPATPYDAKGLMNSALMGTDPVIFFESQRLYDIGEMFHKEGVPKDYYEIPIGEPDIKKQGKDITILTIGATLYRALDSAKILEEKYGLSAEIIDARSIVPFNYEKVLESVKKTGRILLTSDACDRGSHLKDMAQTISELAFDYLDAPPVVVGSKNWITPAHELEDFFFPQPEWIIDAIHEKILPLPGHIAKSNYTAQEMIRTNKLGV
jgi:2-oxoisovalerate dehydrogenase E1 component